MLFLILSLLIINLVVLDVLIFKTAKNVKKQLNLAGNLNLMDLDADFWSEDDEQ